MNKDFIDVNIAKLPQKSHFNQAKIHKILRDTTERNGVILLGGMRQKIKHVADISFVRGRKNIRLRKRCHKCSERSTTTLNTISKK